MPYQILFTSQARKDAKKLSKNNLKSNAEKIFEILKINPYQNPPPYEKLKGDLEGAFSRRLNIQHRIVYQIHEKEKIVKVLRMWTHYE